MSYNEYLQEIGKSDDTDHLNNLIEDAAFNDGLSDDQYEEIYRAALDRAVRC